MAQLSSEQKIANIEQAPEEVQTMIAKAYIREDIDDEDVQYTFNQDTIEHINDNSEEQVIENVNAEEPEGIGAGKFSMRVSRPNGNKNFITTGSGGWNTCVKGYPRAAGADALANCVGYASGRFNEIINEVRGTIGCTYKKLNCNAENFIERAKAAGLEVGSTPRVGAIMCWRKGASLSGKDGAGHVAIVERVDSNNQVYTSESGYASTAFWNQIRKNTNGRWGLNAYYTFRGFIYLPSDVQKVINPTPIVTDPFPGVSNEELAKRVWTGEFGNGDERKNKLGSRYSAVQALVEQGYGKPTPTAAQADPLAGYSDEQLAVKVLNGEFGSGAARQKALGNRYESVQAIVNKKFSAPSLKVGDRVKIVGAGNGSVSGRGATAYGIGWTRQILAIYSGKAFPYRIGNNAGTTGYYKASSLKKI